MKNLEKNTADTSAPQCGCPECRTKRAMASKVDVLMGFSVGAFETASAAGLEVVPKQQLCEPTQHSFVLALVVERSVATKITDTLGIEKNEHVKESEYALVCLKCAARATGIQKHGA